MRDIDRALADIVSIRQQIAHQGRFRGYGPAAIAATGVLAAAVCGLQTSLAPETDPTIYFGIWISTAFLALALVSVEVVTRARRLHSRLANEMIVIAVEQFAPAGAAGALLGLVLARFEPANLWMLPGLWQILVSLGLFSASRALPRAIAIAALWYLVAGLAVLIVASRTHLPAPWMMGVPFAVGQLLAALVLYRSLGGSDAEEG